MLQQALVTRCARCHRTLKAPKAIVAGMGATCARKTAIEAARAELEAQMADEAKAAPVVLSPAIAAQVAPAYQVPAGAPVFAVKAGRPVWGRNLETKTTTRVNTFTADDLVHELPTALVFRLPANREGYGLLMVLREALATAA